MPRQQYQMKVYRDRREVHASDLLVGLDLGDVEETRDLLRRHLIAAAERDDGSRQRAHLYHAEGRRVDGGRVAYEVSFRFALPVEED